EPGEGHAGGDADPEEPALSPLRALGGLLLPALGIARQRQRAVERAQVVAAVVNQRDLGRPRPHLPRELVAPDHVASAQLRWIYPELLGQVIERALGGEHRLRLARATVGASRRLAGQRRPGATGVVANAVRPRENGRGDRGTQHAEAAAVGAEV